MSLHKTNILSMSLENGLERASACPNTKIIIICIVNLSNSQKPFSQNPAICNKCALPESLGSVRNKASSAVAKVKNIAMVKGEGSTFLAIATNLADKDIISFCYENRNYMWECLIWLVYISKK